MGGPNIAKTGPYVLEMEAGIYKWCGCGHSKNQPFCDGSHKGSGFAPLITEITEKKKVAWCGCKHTKNKPFCDGSHGEIKGNF